MTATLQLIWGIVLIVFTLLLAWLAQIVNAIAPATAARWGLSEGESDVDATFYADSRAEAIWDAAIIWPLPAAGILLVLDNPLWVYAGLVGGGMYLYFAGRGIVARVVMQRRAIRVGKSGTVRLYYLFLGLWALIALVTIGLAVAALPLP